MSEQNERRASALGAFPGAEGTSFRVWSTRATLVEVRLFDDERTAAQTFPLEARGDGLFEATVADARPGTLYKFVLDGDEVPDPYARFLPFGVHGPAEVVPEVLAEPPGRTDRPLSIYELHVGAFTPEGTYAAAAQKLETIAALGVSAVELMPVSSFPGARGWGYDGVAHFAPYAPYGRPDDLRQFVRQAHRLGLLVLLDVVYNHFGPQGNYLARYSPEYFTKAVETPWGEAPNFEHTRMREYVLENARYWFDQFGFDGLRLDATHAIHDPSPKHILRALHEVAAAYSPPRRVIAEDDRNEPALVTEMGLDGIWADDFHHQVHVLLTGERDGYYAGYEPSVADLVHVIRRGWSYEGQVYPPGGKPRGKPADALTPEQLVYCIQNHDQIGNRALGTRLDREAGASALCAATMLLLFLPTTPLIFMGQEWAASTPFLYFTDHAPEFGELVSKGRRDEFKTFRAFADAEKRAHIPDPQAADTFERSKLKWDERDRGPHKWVLDVVRAMLRIRREDAVLREPSARGDVHAEEKEGVLLVERKRGAERRTLLVNLHPDPRMCDVARYGAVMLRSKGPTPGAPPATLGAHAAVLLTSSGAPPRTPNRR